MKAQYRKKSRCKALQQPIVLMVAFGLIGFFAGYPEAIAGADPPSQAIFFKANQTIHITADEVIANLDSGETRFLGNVKISQGQTVVTADRMDVYFTRPEGDVRNLDLNVSIHKVVAGGNVQINYENVVALTDKAVYMADSNSLILSGRGSKVISGASSITGPRFVMSLESGSLTIEGSHQQQVKALIFPGGMDLF